MNRESFGKEYNAPSPMVAAYTICAFPRLLRVLSQCSPLHIP
jgi:hypothetical protein